MSKNKKNQVAKISIFITSIFVIFLSVTYAFINMTITGTKRQVITAGSLEIELEEENVVTVENAMPMYDEIGMIQESFNFKLINKNNTDADYVLKLVDITDVSKNKLNSEIIRYGLTKDGVTTIGDLSELEDYILDSETIKGNQTINYNLRLWINSNVENNDSISEKKLTYRIDVDITLSKRVLLATMKQGDYVAYVGNNGCQNNGIDTTGTSDAESKNSCLGWNANQADEDTGTFGYCDISSYQNTTTKYTTSGWRIAYTEDERAYLVSAGSPECHTFSIPVANEKAKKYCNDSFVDGDCSDNADSWAINDSDFYKITSAINNENGRHLLPSYGSPTCWNVSSAICGLGNDLLDNGGNYWFAATHPSSNPGVVWWAESKRVLISKADFAYGLRPIIRLSSSVYVTGGSGTMDDPYTIAN